MMKNIKRFVVLTFVLGAASMFQACSDDEASSASFEQVYAEYDESDGTGTVTVPVRGSTGGVEFVLGGTATEGEDYEFLGLGPDGVEISVIDDTDFEDAETVTVRMEGAGAGNTIFELTILSDCDYDAAEYDEVSMS